MTLARTIVAGLAAAAAIGSTTVAAQATPGIDIIVGTNADNVIGGDAGRDRIYGYGGDDRIRGKGSHDEIYGGRGHDRLYGGPGTDWLVGDAGRDRIDARWRDRVRAGSGNDRITVWHPTKRMVIRCGSGYDRVDVAAYGTRGATLRGCESVVTYG